jgi:SAM-dependent methyltransferase
MSAAESFREPAADALAFSRRASRLLAKRQQRRLINSCNRVAAVMRRRYYLDGRKTLVWQLLPPGLRLCLGVNDAAAVGSHRIEIGSGSRPQPGYIHVDCDAAAQHVEIFAPAWRLPFPDGWAAEILAIHVLEHIPPCRLYETLREWKRVLGRGGRLRVHVPDSNALITAFLDADVGKKWALAGALLGMYANASVRRPEDLRAKADHQILFDRDLLRAVLSEAGFCDFVDRSEEITDVHTEGWKDLVPRLSLVFDAYPYRRNAEWNETD